MNKCPHGREIGEFIEGLIDEKECLDPNDDGIMEFYQVCNCCMIVGHNSTMTIFPPGIALCDEYCAKEPNKVK